MSIIFRAKHSRALNIFMLIAGFGVGQGSIFLAQTWLVLNDKMELLALFGTHFSFAMLGIMLVEAGSITVLARCAALTDDAGSNLWRTFTETCCVRLIFALVPLMVSLWPLPGRADSDFSTNFALFAAPAYVIWAFNAAGLLDGFKLSGLSGISGALCYLAPSGALFFSMSLPLSQVGAITGISFSFGYFLTVGVQMLALWYSGRRPRLMTPTVGGFLNSFRTGVSMLGTALPGQVYFRLQLFICATWLGTADTAALVYIKQLTSAVIQLIGFIRRTEFPYLVTKMSAAAEASTAILFKTQRLGTSIATAFSIAFLCLGTVLSVYGQISVTGIGEKMIAFSPTIFTSTIALTLNQGLAAMGRYWSITLVSGLALIAGLAVSLALATTLGVAAFAAGDVAANALGTVVALYLFRRKSNNLNL